jgi:hypothetical protein
MSTLTLKFEACSLTIHLTAVARSAKGRMGGKGHHRGFAGLLMEGIIVESYGDVH